MKISTRITTSARALYWGPGPLPDGAELLGIVTREAEDTGVLLRMPGAGYHQGNAGALQPLPPAEVEAALAASAAASALGSIGRGAAKRRDVDYGALAAKARQARRR